jgi:hypothetical protein
VLSKFIFILIIIIIGDKDKFLTIINEPITKKELDILN